MKLDSALDFWKECRSISGQLKEHWKTNKRWDLILQYYKMAEPAILNGTRIGPYGIGLDNYLTPIERALWNDIRCMGLPFYMQYPVGRRFVDFGDPVYQIAIEADGKEFHTPEKDAAKDRDLEREGWRVFRVTGHDCMYARAPLAEILPMYERFEGQYDWYYRDEEEAA